LSTNLIPLHVEQTGLKVRGRVSDRQGLALNGAWVSIGEQSSTTDINGAFQLFVPGTPPQLEVEVTNSGYQRVTFSTNSSASPLDIRLVAVPPAPGLTPPPDQPKPPLDPNPPPAERPEVASRIAVEASPNNAKARCDYGDYLYRVQDLEGAEQQFTRAVELAQVDAEKEPMQMECLATALNGLGLVKQGQGDTDRALLAFGRALDSFSRLPKNQSVQCRAARGTTYLNRARTSVGVRDYQAAIKDGEAALNDLSAELRTGAKARGTVAGAQALVGWAEFNLGQRPKAEAAFQAAMTNYLAADVRADQAQSPEHRNFANALNLYALYLEKGPELTRTSDAYEQAVAYQRDALTGGDSPGVQLLARRDLAITLRNLAYWYNRSDECRKARDRGNEALALFQGLAAANPSAFNPEVAETKTLLAGVLSKLKDPLALEQQNEAVKIYRELARTSPLLTAKYAASLHDRAELLLKSGTQKDRETARSDFANSVALYRNLLASKTVWTNHIDAAGTLFDYAIFLNGENQRAKNEEDVKDAEAAYRGALEIYTAGGFEERAAATEHAWGILRYNVFDVAGTRTHYAAAVDRGDRYSKQNPQDQGYGVILCGYRLDLAQVCLELFVDKRQAADRDRAQREFETAKKLRKKLSDVPGSGLDFLELDSHFKDVERVMGPGVL